MSLDTNALQVRLHSSREVYTTRRMWHYPFGDLDRIAPRQLSPFTLEHFTPIPKSSGTQRIIKYYLYQSGVLWPSRRRKTSGITES